MLQASSFLPLFSFVFSTCSSPSKRRRTLVLTAARLFVGRLWAWGLALSLCASFATFAQEAAPPSSPEKMREIVKATSEGREFWLCFQKNGIDPEPDKRTGRVPQREQIFLELFITANEDSRVTIEIDGLLFKQETLIRGGTVLNVKIDTAAQIRSSEKRERLAVHIVAEKPVSVYGLSHRYQTTDTYMGLPTDALGTEYRAIGYYKLREDLISQLAVVAAYDSTIVTITPKSPTFGGKPADAPFTVSLKKGDVYQVIGASPGKGKPSDLTGSLIQSNKPIAVFSGHSGAYVPIPEKGYNHLVEQLPPVTAWGRHYYVGTLFGRTKSTVRVVAAENDTKVFANGKFVAILNAGDYYEDGDVMENTQITGDKRIMVAQYAHGFENSRDSVGDPMMILLTPTQQFLKRYRMLTPIRGEWRHYVNIVVPRAAASTLRVDGRPLGEKVFEPFGESRYAIAQISLAYGTHTFECAEPFGLYSYGFGYGGDSYDAYGNMVGQSFLELRAVKDELPPTMELMYGGIVEEPPAGSQSSLPRSAQIGGGEIVKQTPQEPQNINAARPVAGDTLTPEEQFERILRKRALARLARAETNARFSRGSGGLFGSLGGGVSKILVRDDREDDRGIQLVRVIDAGGLSLFTPSVTPGSPQVSIIFDEARQTASGRALLEAVDVAGNKSIYTLCFSKDELAADNVVTLSEGETDYCPKRTLWYAGVFGALTLTSHEASFTAPAVVPARARFSGEPGGVFFPTLGGAVVGRRISSLFGVSARVALERFPGAVRAPDTVPAASVRLLDGSVTPLWLSQTLALNNLYASASLAGEVFLLGALYGVVGAKASVALGAAVDSRAEVVSPDNFSLLNRPENAERSFSGDLSTLQPVVFSAFGGLGVSAPLWRNLSLNVEALYTQPLSSMVDNGDWFISQFSLNLGLRIRL